MVRTVNDQELKAAFSDKAAEVNFKPHFIQKNKVEIKLPDQIHKFKKGDHLYLRGPYGNGFDFENYRGKNLIRAVIFGENVWV